MNRSNFETFQSFNSPEMADNFDDEHIHDIDFNIKVDNDFNDDMDLKKDDNHTYHNYNKNYHGNN